MMPIDRISWDELAFFVIPCSVVFLIYCVIIVTQLRLRKLMEKELAEHANELKQFITVASHEIRTPLHTLIGYCDLLALTHLSEDQTMYITSIRHACHALDLIAGNVLGDLSKLGSDPLGLPVHPVPLDLRSMIENLAHITAGGARGQSDHPSLDLVVSITDDVPSSVSLDEAYTFRILMNLLSNAQKFCDTGYIGASVSMISPNRLQIQIRDSGCGIPKSFRAALFQPYTQANALLTRPRPGTGLGLSIVKHLSGRMGGTVDVDSVEGEGACFTVTLPITPLSPPSEAKRLSSLKRVRVIYDHPKAASYFVELFDMFGFVATSESFELSPSELVDKTDVIWTNVNTLDLSPSLLALISCSDRSSLPPIFIVYSDVVELKNVLPTPAHGVAFVKRPIILHSLLTCLEDPASLSSVLASSSPESGIPSQRVIKGRVLLAEDNPLSQGVSRRILEKIGYEVTTADNGHEAVKKARDGPYVCCIMDCQMPGLDGFDATREIRILEKSHIIQGKLPIIALTADVSEENETRCRSAGMDSFLGKPVRLQEVQDALAQFSL